MTETQTDLTALLERVRSATVPDRELDYAISRFADGELVRNSSLHLPYTSSIDAAVALTERVLPGWAVTAATFHTDHGGPYADTASSDYINNVDGHDDEIAESAGATVPLAILAATLSALIAGAKP